MFHPTRQLSFQVLHRAGATHRHSVVPLRIVESADQSARPKARDEAGHLVKRDVNPEVDLYDSLRHHNHQVFNDRQRS